MQDLIQFITKTLVLEKESNIVFARFQICISRDQSDRFALM